MQSSSDRQLLASYPVRDQGVDGSTVDIYRVPAQDPRDADRFVKQVVVRNPLLKRNERVLATRYSEDFTDQRILRMLGYR